jgi:RimJ/RimL family protein N-acetyltransferase
MELRAGPIVLRPWCEADAPVVHAACQDPEIQRWIPGIPRPYTRDHALAFVTGRVGLGPHHFAVVEEGQVIGSIGMEVDGDNASGHVGYWCAAHARGRGIASRALRRLCEHAFDTLNLQRLELVTDPDNRRSQQVAEAVGFRREGVLRSHLRHPDGRRRDSVIYSLLPGELR